MTENRLKPSSRRISTVPDARRIFLPISQRRWQPGSTIDSWALRTIVDPTADGCPRSPYVYHVPWVLYLHLVLLSKNIFPVPEFVVNPSRLPYRTVVDHRRTAQRVQDRFQTGRRGPQRRRLSAANIGSDHVNLGHGEYTVSGRGSLLFNNLVDGPCLHCVPKFFFFPRPHRNGGLSTADAGFSGSFLTFSVVFLHGPTVFRGPHWYLSPLRVTPEINYQYLNRTPLVPRPQ